MRYLCTWFNFVGNKISTHVISLRRKSNKNDVKHHIWFLHLDILLIDDFLQHANVFTPGHKRIYVALQDIKLYTYSH